MAKFTKGPWKYAEGTQGEIYDADGELVLQVKPQNCPMEEAEANLRMVALGPTFLKGMKLAVAEFKRISYQKKCDPKLLASMERLIRLAEK